MKWLYTINQDQQEIFELQKDGKMILSLSLNPSLGTTRINYINEKRTFMLAREGFLKRKTVLRNEYGFKLGQIEPDRNDPLSGSIEMENKNFNYCVSQKDTVAFSLYEAGSSFSMLTCAFVREDNGLQKRSKSYMEQDVFPCLLMMLCWHASKHSNLQRIPVTLNEQGVVQVAPINFK